MSSSSLVPAFLIGLLYMSWGSHSLMLSSRLIHRFSEEVREIRVSRAGVMGGSWWPSKGSMEYCRELVGSDLLRRQRKNRELEAVAAKFDLLYPSRGSDTMSLGNDFGWLHYTWIDIGTPNVSFLVALDAGSDLSWVPCDCIQCAPLSSEQNNLKCHVLAIKFGRKPVLELLYSKRCSLVFGASIMQDRDLNMYVPADSSTSKVISCSHELCALGPSCKTPKQPCPYSVSYYSENTSSLGLLIEDTLHLASDDNHALVKAPVVIGCGKQQSGSYLDGIAPDGLLGLGFGDISIPSLLAKEGLVPNSFSMCFRDDDSGRILFGDRGVPTQRSTPFVPLDGKYITYIVQVDSFCIGTQCYEETKVQALMDSGSSFTFIPHDVYKKVTSEFDKQMNGSRFIYEGAPWEYCYKASSLQLPTIPQLTLMFAVNKSFIVNNPIFLYYGKEGDLDGFCLALQSSEDNLGTIGQNFMTGYRIIFDREKYKLGWSRSDCNDMENSRSIPITHPPDRHENPLPTNEQQSSANNHGVSPAEAGRAQPANSSRASRQVHFGCFTLLLLLVSFSVIFGG